MLLDKINSSLITGYIPQSLKVAVIDLVSKKPTVDPLVLVNYRQLPNIPFISTILEKMVAKQLCNYLLINNLITIII